MRTRNRSFDATFAIAALATSAAAVLFSGFLSLGPKDYSARADALRESVASGDAEQIKNVEKNLEKKIKGTDRLLYLEERGRILSLAGDIPGSTTDYKNAAAISERIRTGRETATNGDKNAKSTQIIYKNSVFEDAALQNFLALNLIAFKDVDGAVAEIDEISALYASKAKSDQTGKAFETAAREKIDLENALKAVESRTRRSDSIRAGDSCASGEALGQYLKGALDETAERYDEALADYKKVLQLCPFSRFAAESAMRCARICGSKQDQADLLNRFGNALKGNPVAKNEGRLIVIFEAGMIMKRSPTTVAAGYKGSNAALTLPVIEGTRNPPDELDVSCGQTGAHTQTIFDIDEAAAKELIDNYPALIVRCALAIGGKSKSKPADADLRSWLTLPQAIEIAELVLPAGHQTLKCSTSSATQNVDLDIQGGATTILVVAQPGRNIIVRSIVPQVTRISSEEEK